MLINIYKAMLLLGIAVFSTACSGEKKDLDSKKASTRSETKDVIGKKFLMVTINNLRIRSTPDLEGAVLERLREKAVLEFLNDSTSFTTAVKLNGKNYEQAWYKVKSENGNEGWIYGACTEFLSDEENRRVLALREDAEAQQRAAIEAGVTVKNGKTPSIVQEAPKIDLVAVERYRSLLVQISASDPAALTRAISLFESVFNQTASATADMAFGEFLQFHRRLLQHHQSRVNLVAYQSLSAEIQNYGSANMELDATTRQLDANGLTFGLKNNKQVYLKENVDFLMRRFFRMVSPTLREYLEQYAVENESPAMEGDQIAVPITELAAYTVFWDKFLARHPHFSLKEAIAVQRKHYASLLLSGTFGEPAFKSNVLNDDFKEAYRVMTRQMGISTVIKAMQQYVEILEVDAFRDSDRAAAMRKEILEKL